MQGFFFSNILFILFALITNASFIRSEAVEMGLKDAQATYQRAVEASTFSEREEGLNKALSLFHSLYLDNHHSSYLNEVLGDLYLQLNDYPWAILHYERSLQQGGGGINILTRLKEAKERVGISELKLEEEIMTHRLFSLSRHPPLLFGALCLAFISLSCAIWFPLPVIRKGAFALLLIFIALWGSSLFYYYFSPVEGILVQSTGLYREPNIDQIQKVEKPLLAGTKVEILKVSTDGQWLKIRGEAVGYIPIQALQPIL